MPFPTARTPRPDPARLRLTGCGTAPDWRRLVQTVLLTAILVAVLAFWPLRSAALTMMLDTTLDATALGGGQAEALTATATFGPAGPGGWRALEGISLGFLGGEAAGRFDGVLVPLQTPFGAGILASIASDEEAVIARRGGAGPLGGYRLSALTIWLPGQRGLGGLAQAEGRLFLDLLDGTGLLTRVFAPIGPGSLSVVTDPPVQATSLAAAPPAVPLPASGLLLAVAAGALVLRGRAAARRAGV